MAKKKRAKSAKRRPLQAFTMRVRVETARESRDLVALSFDPEAVALLPPIMKQKRKQSPEQRAMDAAQISQLFGMMAQVAQQIAQRDRRGIPVGHVDEAAAAAFHKKLEEAGYDRCPICGAAARPPAPPN